LVIKELRYNNGGSLANLIDPEIIHHNKTANDVLRGYLVDDKGELDKL
jgi:hypothetical protein